MIRTPKRTFFQIASGATLLLTLAGCGGGGSAPTASGSRTGTVGVFVTDAFKDDFSQVWVTLYKIEATSDGTTYSTLYENASGKTINVSSLATSAQLLASVSLPATTYRSLRVTIGDHLTLVPKAGGTGQSVPVEDSLGVHANEKVTLPLSASLVLPSDQSANFVLDFDLTGFELSGGRVKPALRRGDDSHFQQADKRAELEGTVLHLTAGSGFDLMQNNGKTISIRLSSTTVIFQSRQGTPGTLAEGQRVEVKGSVDPATHTVTADRVKIEDGSQSSQSGDDHGGQNGGGDQSVTGADAEGRVASVDTTAKTFVLTPEEAEHFQPASGSLTIKTDANTVFARHHDGGGSFADIAAGAKVEVTGTFDPATNTLTAVRVEIKGS